MPNCLIDSIDAAVPVHAVSPDGYGAWLDAQDARTQAWISSAGFTGQGGQTLALPGSGGELEGLVYVIGGDDGRGGPWGWAALYGGLPKGGAFYFAEELNAEQVNDAALGFALASYAFDRYRTLKVGKAEIGRAHV